MDLRKKRGSPIAARKVCGAQPSRSQSLFGRASASYRTAQSGLARDGVLVEALLQDEAKATPHGVRTFVVLLKQGCPIAHLSS